MNYDVPASFSVQVLNVGVVALVARPEVTRNAQETENRMIYNFRRRVLCITLRVMVKINKKCNLATIDPQGQLWYFSWSVTFTMRVQLLLTTGLLDPTEAIRCKVVRN